MDAPELITQKELADRTGYSERHIRRYRDKGPKLVGHLYNPAEWIPFLEKHGRKPVGDAAERKRLAEARILEAKAEREEKKNDRDDDEWMHRGQWEPVLNQFAADIRQHLKVLLEEHLPSAWLGKSAAELKAAGKAEFDDLMDRIHSGAERAVQELATGKEVA